MNDLDTLEGISEKLKQMGFEVHIQDVQVQDRWDRIEAAGIGGDMHYFPGMREITLDIQAVLIEDKDDPSQLDELKEAIDRFDESVKPFTENT